MTTTTSTSPIDFYTLNSLANHHLYATDPDALYGIEDVQTALEGDTASILAEGAVSFGAATGMIDLIPDDPESISSRAFAAGFQMGMRVAATVIASPLVPNIPELKSAIDEARKTIKIRKPEAA